MMITAAMMLLLLLCGASAEAERKLTAACPSLCDAKVTAQWQNEEIVLSLPGAWDLTRVTLETADRETLLIGSGMTPVRPGEPADLTGFVGKRVAVRNEQKRSIGYLTVLQGSGISALFLEVDADRLVQVKGNKKEQLNEGRLIYMEPDSTVSYDGPLDQLKTRGNGTFKELKKPYQFKLHKKTPLSGMSKGRTWILLASFGDATLLRNQIVLDMSRETGLKNALKCVQTDLWINGSYQGLYLLTEKIQIGKNRISITDLEEATEKVNPSPFNPGKGVLEQSKKYPLLYCYPDIADPEDITGGYIMTIEKTHRMKYEEAGFRNTEKLSIRIKEPTYPSRKQTEYVYKRITEMQEALMDSGGVNPKTGKKYTEYLDTTSFAQRYLIEEWTADYDFLGGSQYLYKDSDLVDPLIYAGPSWDYDLCFGNRKEQGYRAGDEYVTNSKYRQNANLYWLLSRHASFRKTVCDLWKKDFRPAVEILLGEKKAGPDSVIRSLDEYREQIRKSVTMNFVRWHAGGASALKTAEGRFNGAVQSMRNWISERTAWMDRTYPAGTGAGGD
ncbi:MAG: CotH kinase family protein [Clostridia bacterium]|nr:CotH kinase family protein [Clostridia bacterium]